MKTADRENPNRWAAKLTNRASGAEDKNRSCYITWAAKQEKLQPLEWCFFLTSPFIELTRSCERKSSAFRCMWYATLSMVEVKHPNECFTSLGNGPARKPPIPLPCALAREQTLETPCLSIAEVRQRKDGPYVPTVSRVGERQHLPGLRRCCHEQ